MKKINYHNLDRITMLYDRIEELNYEIQELQDFSGNLIQGQLSVALSLFVFNEEEEMRKEAARKRQYDQFVQMCQRPVPPSPGAMPGMVIQMEVPQEPPITNLVLSESECLRVLQILVDIKTKEKINLYRELRKLGVKIQNKQQ